MRYFSTIILLPIVFLLNSCSTSAIYIDRTTSFNIKDVASKHIVSISPNFNLPATLDPTIAEKRQVLSSRDALWFYESLKQNAKNHGIFLQIEGAAEIIETYDSKYFNYLAPLKREILQVLNAQDFSKTNNSVGSGEQIKKEENVNKNHHEKGLLISSHHSHLAEKYGTPYFAIQGISFVPKNNKGKQELQLAATLPSSELNFATANVQTVYYTVIVDVSLSEIVYREFRVIKLNSNQKQFNAFINDSFSAIVH